MTVGIRYCYDGATTLSVAVWDGAVSSDERRRHMACLAADPEWGRSGLLLTDLTGVPASSYPTPERIVEAAGVFLDRLAGRARNGKWALVAGAAFEHAQRFGACIEEEVPRVIVFNTLDTACTWLGVDALAAGEVVDSLRRQIRTSSTRQPAPDGERGSVATPA